MKKYLLISFLCFLFLQSAAHAQDIILKRTGDEIKAKVVEITVSQVLFKLPEQTRDSIHALPRQDVFMVTFANGSKEVLHPESSDTAQARLTPTQMGLMGKKDAKIYYKGSNAMWASAATVFLFPPAVLVIGAIPPKIKPTEVSNPSYLSDPSYAKEYKRQAHKRKVGKVLIGTGIGVVSLGVASFVMIMANYNSM